MAVGRRTDKHNEWSFFTRAIQIRRFCFDMPMLRPWADAADMDCQNTCPSETIFETVECSGP